MELNGVVQVFLGGMLGPVLMEGVKLVAYQSAARLPDKYRRLQYWLLTLLLLLLGGVVAVLNGVEQVHILRAVEFGIAAPAIIAGYATASERGHASFMGEGEEHGGAPTLRSLLAW